jgi:hypothetical protein
MAAMLQNAPQYTNVAGMRIAKTALLDSVGTALIWHVRTFQPYGRTRNPPADRVWYWDLQIDIQHPVSRAVNDAIRQNLGELWIGHPDNDDSITIREARIVPDSLERSFMELQL